MISNLSQPESILKRCAICKIDLKGRFVYIDDQFESVLGLTKEELFGKSLFDFLDYTSQSVIEYLLNQRNHYEIFFDTTELMVINAKGAKIPTKAVITLNFIAGNPVNFQLILDRQNSITPSTIVNDSKDYKILIENVIMLNNQVDHNRILSIIRDFTEIPKIGLYILRENKLELRAAATNQYHEFSFRDFPATSQIHLDYAGIKEEYSCLNEKMVQDAIEKYQKAPEEFFTTVDFGDGNEYLLRFILEKNKTPAAFYEAIEKAKISVSLISRYLTINHTQADKSNELIDIKFTIGFLESINIPAFLIDRDGNLIGYNPSLQSCIDRSKLEGTYVKLFDSIAQYNRDGLINKIIDYVTSPYENGNNDILETNIILSQGIEKKLVVLKISDNMSDLSSCFVLLPEEGRNSEKKSSQDFMESWYEIFGHIRNQLLNTGSLAEKITHRLFSDAPEHDRNLIRSFNKDCFDLNRYMERVQEVLELSNSPLDDEKVDLNIIIENLIKDIQNQYPGVTLNYSSGRLPGVRTKKLLIIKVLEEIITNAFKFAGKKELNLNIGHKREKNNCILTISDNGPGIDSGLKDSLFSLKPQKCEGHSQKKTGIGLAFCKLMIEMINGEIIFASTKKNGTDITLKIPGLKG